MVFLKGRQLPLGITLVAKISRTPVIWLPCLDRPTEFPKNNYGTKTAAIRAIAPIQKFGCEGVGGREVENASRPLITSVARKAAKDEAERLIRDYGKEAYRTVAQRLGAARRRRHKRMEEFLVQVAQEVEHRLRKTSPPLKRAGNSTSGQSSE